MDPVSYDSRGGGLVPTSGGTALSGFEGLQGPAPEGEEGPKITLQRALAAVRRYKWLILAIVVLGTAASVAATRLLSPLYRASGTIYVAAPTSSQSGPIRPDQVLQNESWPQLIRSFAVVEPVVLEQRLYLGYDEADADAFRGFAPADRFAVGQFRLLTDATGRSYSLLNASGSVIEQGAVGDSVGHRLGFRWAPGLAELGASRDLSFSVRPPRAVSEAILSSLTVLAPQRSALISVSLSLDSPEKAARTLNGILDQFVVVADRLKRDKLADVTVDLSEQIRIADSTMRSAESSLEQFRVTTITQPKLETQAPLPSGLQQTQQTVMTAYFGKRLSLDALQKERRAIEALLRQTEQTGAVPVDAFHMIEAVQRAPDLTRVLGEVSTAEQELRTARARYTDEHEVVVRVLARLRELNTTVVPEYARRLVNQMAAREAQLTADIATDSRELQQIPVRTHTEDRLQRDAATAITLRQNLQERLQEARLAELTATPDVGILDRAAVPEAPSSQTALTILLIGIAASIGLALGLAILLDHLDKRFRYPEQITKDLGLTILGVVPVIRHGRNGAEQPDDAAQIVEAFRSIRMNLAHSFEAGEPIAITITSPSPGDGKSLITSNLAVSFAEAGYRTVLIDGDTRRGQLDKTFNVERKPGLLDFLSGGLTVDDIVKPTGTPQLSFISCGTRSRRGPELLGSALMVDLLHRLRSRFQVILIDSPPLGAGIDPFVLATMAGNMALVVRAGETDRQLAEAKLEIAGRLPTRLLGAILNHIEVGVGAYRYYAYDYTDLSEPDQLTPESSSIKLPVG